MVKEKMVALVTVRRFCNGEKMTIEAPIYLSEMESKIDPTDIAKSVLAPALGELIARKARLCSDIIDLSLQYCNAVPAEAFD